MMKCVTCRTTSVLLWIAVATWALLWSDRDLVQAFIFEKPPPFKEQGLLHRVHASDITSDTDATSAAKPLAKDSFIKARFEVSSFEDLPVVRTPSTNKDYSGSFPLGLLVDQLYLKQALILAASNPALGSLVVYGGKGTGKSTLCRAAYRLLEPTIERIRGSPFQIDPESDPSTADSILIDFLNGSNQTLMDLPTETVPTPLVTVPVNCQEDNLLGTVDLEKSMSSGQHVLEPGLLARAHRGILLVDDCHLLDESIASQLWNALTDGYVTVEREGLSVRYPCQPRLVLAAYNPDEGDVREHWLDRVSMVLPMTTNTLTIEERVEAVQNVEGFRDKTEDLTSAIAEEEDVRETVAKARRLLPYVQIERQQLIYLCEEASRADCEGQRAEIFAVQIAKTAAALNGRIQVQASDLELGVMLAIVPRAHAPLEQGGESAEETTTSQPDSPLQPLPPDKPNSDTPLQDPPDEQADADNEPEEDNTDQDQEQDEPTADETQETQEQHIPEEFLFGVEHANLDPRLLSYKRHTKKGKGGKRARMFNLQRGHFVKAIFPRGDWKMGRIAVGATLRAAAPYQLIRRARAGDGKLIHVRKGDFRIKRLARKAGSLIIFVVDASGSMALNRMGAAKGAAMSLLKEAYKSRDKICLIAFHDQQADVVVPPTKSMALTRARLEAMPCGGRSPLAHGLTVATRTGLNAIKVKQDVGKVIVVLISDGRPTVPLCISEGEEFDALNMDPSSKDGEPSRSFCKNEVLAIARTIGSLKDIDLLVVDTEDKFVGIGISSEIAKHGQGTYERLDSTDVYSVDRITKQHIGRLT